MPHRAEHFKRTVKISRQLFGHRPRRKLPRKLHPTSIVIAYYKALRAFLDQARSLVTLHVLPMLPGLAVESQFLRRDAARADGRFNDEMDKLSKEFFDRLRPEDIERMAEENARRTVSWEKQEAMKQIRAAFGVDVLAAEPALRPQVEAFVSENVALIKSIPNKYFDDVEARVSRAVNEGATPASLAQELEDAYDLSSKRAQLIARDQIGKLYGNVAEARNKQMGVRRYFWRTSRDERVRQEHAALGLASDQGKTFTYDEGATEDGENPGEPINCFPGDTLLLAQAPVEVAYRRWYSGECTVIFTDDGGSLCATPNHPILTRSGFVPAKDVEVGEDVFEAAFQSIQAFGMHDHEHVASRAEDVFRAAHPVGVSQARRSLPAWFHGDGVLDEQVDVVLVDWRLGLELDASVTQRLCYDALVLADKPGLSLGPFAQFFGAALTSEDRAVRGLCKLLALGFGGQPHAKGLRFAATTWLDAAIDQCSAHHSARDLKVFRDSLHAPLRAVQGDDLIARQLFAIGCRALDMPTRLHAARAQETAQPITVNAEGSGYLGDRRAVKKPLRVVKKLVREDSVHVYNLQTSSGWYVAQNLIVSNCRCYAEPDFSAILESLEE